MDNNELLAQIATMLEQQTQDIKLEIENKVTKRIDVLFDGYKLANEKLWEQERQIETLATKLDDLQNRLFALESRIA